MAALGGKSRPRPRLSPFAKPPSDRALRPAGPAGNSPPTPPDEEQRHPGESQGIERTHGHEGGGGDPDRRRIVVLESGHSAVIPLSRGSAMVDSETKIATIAHHSHQANRPMSSTTSVWLLAGLVALLTPTAGSAQILETETARPVGRGVFKFGGNFEYQRSNEGHESALPLLIEYGFSSRPDRLRPLCDWKQEIGRRAWGRDRRVAGPGQVRQPQFSALDGGQC